MLNSLADAFPIVKMTFDEASETLGYDLWELSQHGPESRLNQTQYTQPAMLAADVSVFRVLTSMLPLAPKILAGHSLGEYAALVCAETLSFTSAINLVAERGKLMQEAVPEGQGAIAAILGLPDERVIALCAESCDGGIVSAVNFNAPGQVAVAGHTQNVERLMELAKTAGAKKVIRLALSVPVHCVLMRPAADKFSEILETVALKRPIYPVVHNVDVKYHPEKNEIREALANQIWNPVRWSETVQHFRNQNITTVLEIGPGKVLTGLTKRIDRSLTALSIADPESLDKAVAWLESL